MSNFDILLYEKPPRLDETKYLDEVTPARVGALEGPIAEGTYLAGDQLHQATILSIVNVSHPADMADFFGADQNFSAVSNCFNFVIFVGLVGILWCQDIKLWY